jgi:hypothetical protein
MAKYGLLCIDDKSLTGPSWVIDSDRCVVLYSSVAEAQRDLKKNFVSQDYEIVEYKNNGRIPRSRKRG